MDVLEWNVVHKKEVLQTRHISSLKELKNIFAYKIEYFMNDKVISEKQGLATYEVLKVYLETGKWAGDFLGVMVNINSLKNILKDPRENLKLKDISILNPYDCGVFISEDSDYSVVMPIPQNGKIHDYLGDYYPTGIFMNYSQGYINNYTYDLEEFLEVLKKRDDIVFEKAAVIELIPSFNVTSKEYETISFWWIPTKEDYEKAFTNGNLLQVFEIPEAIFGIKPKNPLY